LKISTVWTAGGAGRHNLETGWQNSQFVGFMKGVPGQGIRDKKVMRFYFKPGESPKRGVRRIATAHASAAAAALSSGDPLDAKMVHKLRQRCKRLRALMRLARPALADDRIYVFENAAIRSVAGNFAAVRDAHVMLDTLDGLLADNEEILEPSAFTVIRAGFRADLEAAEAEHLALWGGGYDRIQAELVGLRDRVAAWTFRGKALARVAKGFTLTYRRARNLWRTVQQDPTVANLHELRKYVKHHHDQMSLLRNLMAKPSKKRRALAKELGEILGLLHDLAVLELRLTAGDRFAASGKARNILVYIAQERRGVLHAQAFRLAKRLFRAKPGRVARGITASGAGRKSRGRG
jgi:CHAD domain-containing protein